MASESGAADRPICDESVGVLRRFLFDLHTFVVVTRSFDRERNAQVLCKLLKKGNRQGNSLSKVVPAHLERSRYIRSYGDVDVVGRDGSLLASSKGGERIVRIVVVEETVRSGCLTFSPVRVLVGTYSRFRQYFERLKRKGSEITELVGQIKTVLVSLLHSETLLSINSTSDVGSSLEIALEK